MSKQPTFKAALLSRLQADAGLNGVQVTYGLPFPKALEREAIIVWGTRPEDPTGGRSGGQSSAALGAQKREERWVQEIVVTVVKPSRESQQTVTERAFAVAAEIEDSIRSWGSESPAFGGNVRWALVTDMRLEEPANQEEREGRVTIDVACAERI